MSCHGGPLEVNHSCGAHSSRLISRFLSSRLPASAIYPFTRLYLCFSDEDKRKHSIICSPFLSLILFCGLFRQGSQAWLAIVTWPRGGKIGTHAPRRSWAQAHTKMYVQTHKCGKKENQSQFCLVWLSLEQGTVGEGWEEVGNFAFFNVSHHPQGRHTCTDTWVSVWRQKDWAVFWCLSLCWVFYFCLSTPKPTH